MIRARKFPLLAKVLCWLMLHLLILGLCFFLFVRWQLGLGLDSLLSGSAGERLAAFGDSAVEQIADRPASSWTDAIKPLADAKKVTAAVFDPTGNLSYPLLIPENVLSRAKATTPPQRMNAGPTPRGPGRPPRPGFDPRRPPAGIDDAAEGPRHPPPDDFPPRGENPEGPMFDRSTSVFMPKSRPAFLMRGDHGGGYWAGVLIHLPPVRNMPRQPLMLLVRADRLDGSGMFFDFKPWLWGGIAVLILSLVFWTPLVWSITRYVRRLTSAADHIASGRFTVSIPDRGSDELGDLGRTIETMAARLDHLVSGQKRFLGDAAHELCAPLARIRTGLGVLEMKLHGTEADSLASIESDVAELAALVNEILAFSRAGNRSPSLQTVPLEPLIQKVIARESAGVETELSIPAGLVVTADPALLGRAVGNLLRNAAIHAGPEVKVLIHATETTSSVSISVTDYGPGVPPQELARLFEPFYRLDRSRSRDTGGSGLGLAIVRTAIEACGGEAFATLPESGGFSVTLRLPKSDTAAPPKSSTVP
jgi:two-component system, OmpR family, sensor histidine kinase CpxA